MFCYICNKIYLLKMFWIEMELCWVELPFRIEAWKLCPNYVIHRQSYVSVPDMGQKFVMFSQNHHPRTQRTKKQKALIRLEFNEPVSGQLWTRNCQAIPMNKHRNKTWRTKILLNYLHSLGSCNYNCRQFFIACYNLCPWWCIFQLRLVVCCKLVMRIIKMSVMSFWNM